MPLNTPRRWPLIGLSMGLALGIGDTVFLYALGVTMVVEGRDAMLPVSALFTLGYAGFGYVVGRLLVARRQLREDQRVIEENHAKLAQQREALVQAEKLATLGRMAAGVAHEVRNPLGVMRSSAMLLQETLGKEATDQAKVCRFMVEEVDRLDAYIGAILDFARPLSIQTSEVAVSDVVERAVTLAAHHLGERSITTRGEGAVAADADVLVQVVLSLLVNAAEATAPDGRIEVVVEQLTAEHVAIHVQDNGEGIAPDARDKLFEPFFTTKARGTGLGLAMAARVAQEHGGSIRADDEGIGGTGARFTVVLPGVTPQTQARSAA